MCQHLGSLSIWNKNYKTFDAYLQASHFGWMATKFLDLTKISSSTKERHLSKNNNGVEKKFALCN
jgi:hypothetical protein